MTQQQFINKTQNKLEDYRQKYQNHGYDNYTNYYRKNNYSRCPSLDRHEYKNRHFKILANNHSHGYYQVDIDQNGKSELTDLTNLLKNLSNVVSSENFGILW